MILLLRRATENGTRLEEGWPLSSYIVSKVAVSALSRIQQRELLKDENRLDIVLNHVHPGSVRTHLNRVHGWLTTDEGERI